MLNYYTVIVWEVVVFMAFLAFMVKANDLLSDRKQGQLLALFLSVALGILAEWSGTMAAHLGQRQIHIWTKMAELSIAPVIPLLCVEALADALPKRKWLLGLLLFHTGLEVLSGFFGFIYFVDADGAFRHGPFYWLYLLAYLGVTAYALLVWFRAARLYQNRNRVQLVAMLLFLLSGISVNHANTSVKSAWLTVAMVVALLYIFYTDMSRRVDEETMLLNRASYIGFLSRLRSPMTLQILDVDSFKPLAQAHGSEYAEQCLAKVGEVIRRIYGRMGKCFRISHDRFCVILDVDESALKSLNQSFFEALEALRQQDARFPYLSVGYSRFVPGRGTARHAEEVALSYLYRDKERNKIRFGPIPTPAPQEYELSRALKQQPAPSALDTTGLTDRTFMAFSGTTKRGYLYLCNMNTGVSRWSTAAVDYFGLPGEYMLEAGTIWEEHIHPQDRQMYHDDIEAVFSGRRQVHELEYRARNRLGEYVVCTCRGIVLKGNGADPDLFAGTIINHGIVDEVDPVTNLHTNAGFTKCIHRLLEERTPACVVKVGIEHFRHINAMYGQEGGNQVLRLFGIELQDLVAGRGQAFRLEGAKFAFYLNQAEPDEARAFFHRLRDVAENKIQINNLRIPLRICGGAVRLDAQHAYNESMVRSSLIYALEQSAASYRSELVFSEEIRQSMNVENIQLHTDIHRSAMEGCRNFFLCYQPITSFHTGRVIGAEALLRFSQEPYGVVPPDRFIPWLENDPAFITVGNWILRQALSETQPLRQADPHFILNVNITDTQLEYAGFREDVLNILADTGCPPENLCLELTERCRRMDPDFLAEELRFFRSRGISVAIDDFGTGTSSLQLLLQLPLDELKVDRGFLLNALAKPQNLAVLESILQIAQRENLHTCVEGIETREQYECIASLGGDYFQGYYASKPVPVEKFLAFYEEKKKA